MAKHLGESGGENSASQILVVLSDFVVLLHEAIKKHDEREESMKREVESAKKKLQKQSTPAPKLTVKALNSRNSSVDHTLNSSNNIPSGCNPAEALIAALASFSKFGTEENDKVSTSVNEQVSSMKENVSQNDACFTRNNQTISSTNTKKAPRHSGKVATKKQYTIVERGGRKDLHVSIVTDPQE